MSLLNFFLIPPSKQQRSSVIFQEYLFDEIILIQKFSLGISMRIMNRFCSLWNFSELLNVFNVVS